MNYTSLCSVWYAWFSDPSNRYPSQVNFVQFENVVNFKCLFNYFHVTRKGLVQNCNKNYLQKASYYILKDIVIIGRFKVNHKSVASAVCQVLPLECAWSIFLNLKMHLLGRIPTMESLDLIQVHRGWQIKEDVNLTEDFLTLRKGEAVVLNDRAYVYVKESIMSWAPGEHQWQKIADMKIEHTFGSCTVTNGLDSIYIIGGCVSCWHTGTFVQKYNLSINTVTNMQGSVKTLW